MPNCFSDAFTYFCLLSFKGSLTFGHFLYFKMTSIIFTTLTSILLQAIIYAKAWHNSQECLYSPGLGIRSFAHLLICSFRSNQWATVSDSLRSLKTNERPEQIAQVAQMKWVTVSTSLRSLKTYERPWAIRSGCSKKMSEWAICSKCWLKNLESCFLVCFIYNFFI